MVWRLVSVGGVWWMRNSRRSCHDRSLGESVEVVTKQQKKSKNKKKRNKRQLAQYWHTYDVVHSYLSLIRKREESGARVSLWVPHHFELTCLQVEHVVVVCACEKRTWRRPGNKPETLWVWGRLVVRNLNSWSSKCRHTPWNIAPRNKKTASPNTCSWYVIILY